ncbi:MAG: N-6 DNA methylase [Deltaproteobacteria bacterium]|nr:N-6 DNA methylase [Deltaproteobacteria bacterium]
MRLYSGFDYTPPSDGTERGGVIEATVAFHEAADRLADLRAEAIDDGTVWARLGAKLKPKARVSERLLAELKKLGDHLRESLPTETAHALIGRFIYLRYLRERGLLSDARVKGWGLDPDKLFSREITRASFEALIHYVDNWLNGSIFPVRPDAGVTDDEVKLVAGVMLGDHVSGQLHLDFRAYDFSHIPVALLSSIYEQFVAGEGRSADQGAYYTPLPLVQFVLAELHALRPLRPGMRVLDPACGSGAFLVAAYQLLVELRRQEVRREPSPEELRDLLTISIFGVDQDAGACRVTELSLALALLDQLPDDALARRPGFISRPCTRGTSSSATFDPSLPLAADATGLAGSSGTWWGKPTGVESHRRAL